uniref:Uncharacterized protein n=1 Tax=Panagrellus redivivus TaxID=6233 RepID=A0A7E5A2D8_PANRE
MSAPSGSRDTVNNSSTQPNNERRTNLFQIEIDDCINRVYNRQKEIMNKNSNDLIQKHQKLLEQALMTLRSQPIVLPPVPPALGVSNQSTLPTTSQPLVSHLIHQPMPPFPPRNTECDSTTTVNQHNQHKNTSREHGPPSPEEISRRLHHCLNEEHSQVLQKVNDMVEEQKRMSLELEELKKKHNREIKSLKRKQQDDRQQIVQELEFIKRKHHDYDAEIHNQGQLMQLMTLSKALFLDHSASMKLQKCVEGLVVKQTQHNTMNPENLLNAIISSNGEVNPS